MKPQERGRDFMKDFLRGYGFAQDLQARDPAIGPLDCAKPRRLGPMAGEWRAAVRRAPASSTPNRLEGVIGIPARKARNLHNSAQAGDKKARVLLQNFEKGLQQKKDGESGYGWWKDTRTFQAPRVAGRKNDSAVRFHSPPEQRDNPASLPGKIMAPIMQAIERKPEAKGNFDEVARFMYDELIQNSRSWPARVLSVANENPHPLTKTGALAGWAALVWPGHVWDHKPVLTGAPADGRKDAPAFEGRPAKWFRDGQDQYGFELWSNVHYGYVGKHAGFRTDELMAGAGLAQLQTLYRKEGSKRERRKAWGRALKETQGASGLDDPMDSAAVRLGIYLYEKYGDDLTLEQFKDEVRRWPGMKVIHEPAKTDRYIYRASGN